MRSERVEMMPKRADLKAGEAVLRLERADLMPERGMNGLTNKGALSPLLPVHDRSAIPVALLCWSNQPTDRLMDQPTD